MKRALALLVLAVVAFTAQAKDPQYYDVELIIFQNLGTDIQNAEVWPSELKMTPPQRFLALTTLTSGSNATMGPPYSDYQPLLPSASLPYYKF